MKQKLLEIVESQQIDAIKVLKVKERDKDGKEKESTINRTIPDFEVGDTVDVHTRILEGQKERIQVFSGLVIARRGDGLNAMFTVRRIVQGEGVERMFPLHSPKISKIEVKRSGKIRRSKLYYMRERVGKATRLIERKQREKKAEQAPPAAQ